MRARTLTNIEQIESMKQLWPGLKLRGRRESAIRWIGNLWPQFQTYRVEIIHRLYAAPIVRVLSPELIRLPDNEEGKLPHVYQPASDPALCLYDPEADEWDHSILISKSIVPWTLDWLACYEFWLITGKWMGGGRHPSPTPEQENRSLVA